MRLLCFDTETASLKGGVCEIAIVELDEQCNIVAEMQSLIDPEVPITSGSGAIHGIRDEDVADSPTLRQFVEVNGNPFGGNDLVLIAYNAQFDLRMCAEILPEGYRVLDLMRVAKNLWTEVENHKLQTLAYEFRLPTGTAHRAMGDVKTTVELLKFAMAQTGLDMAGMIDLAQQPLSLDSYIGFGKHGPMGADAIDGPKGTRLRNVPKSYIRWYLSQADVDPALRQAFESVQASPGR